MLGTHSGTIRALVGFLYPSYKTVNAVLTESVEDDIMWLKYWSILSWFSLIELILDPFAKHFTGYILLKCIFLVWCMAPIDENGSNLIFSQVTFTITKCFITLPLLDCFSSSQTADNIVFLHVAICPHSLITNDDTRLPIDTQLTTSVELKKCDLDSFLIS